MRVLVAILLVVLPTPAFAAEAPPLLRGAQVLVAFAGAMRASPEVTRTKEEARRRALEVVQRAKEVPFADLVREYSDEPGAAARDGSLGAVSRGMLVPVLERALAQLPVGGVSAAPVETPFGFHVLTRLPDAPRMHLRMILVAFKGALRAHGKVVRSREEAQGIAEEIARQAATTAFDELARRQSDDPTGAKGGDLGEFRPGVLLPPLETAALALAPGQVSKVVETPLGFHLLQRVP